MIGRPVVEPRRGWPGSGTGRLTGKLPAAKIEAQRRSLDR
jgi:hypothetical protein